MRFFQKKILPKPGMTIILFIGSLHKFTKKIGNIFTLIALLFGIGVRAAYIIGRMSKARRVHWSEFLNSCVNGARSAGWMTNFCNAQAERMPGFSPVSFLPADQHSGDHRQVVRREPSAPGIGERGVF